MKAQIITLQSVYNYGTQLQAYATQEKLKEYFDKVEFINYQRPDTRGVGLIKSYAKGSLVRAIAFLPTFLQWRRRFKKFENRLKITAKKYTTEKDFLRFEDDADAYFSGSDQVWNSGWNNGIIPQFYLSFVSDNKPKFAYSSSFGKNRLGEYEIRPVRKYLERYDLISVREESGRRIIEDQLGLTAIQLDDPTLAFDGDYWRNFSRRGSRKIRVPKDKYILIYTLTANKELDDYAKRVAKKAGYKLYRFCTRYDQVIRGGKSLIIPRVEDFVTYIDGAEMVITDSFHATAFSVMLNTQLRVVLPKKYSSRLTDFLEKMCLSEVIVNDLNDTDTVGEEIDFSKINKYLQKNRENYDFFLKKVIKKINERADH